MSEFICACCTTPTRIENRRTYEGNDVCAWCLADHLAVDGDEACPDERLMRGRSPSGLTISPSTHPWEPACDELGCVEEPPTAHAALLAALGPVLDLWACDHFPRIGEEVDPECARCQTMGPLREAYAQDLAEMLAERQRGVARAVDRGVR